MPVKGKKLGSRTKTRRYKQHGGNQYASACSSNSDLSKYMSAQCRQANLHNTNPEAGDLSLAQGAGFLPGLRGGGCTDPDSPMTFDSYRDKIKKNLGVNNKVMQTGGSYYSVNPEEMIGGLARVDKGDSCCQGAVLGGKFVQGRGSGAMCGNQMGGSRFTKKAKKSAGGKKKTGSRKATGKKTKRRTVARHVQRGGQRSMPAAFPDSFNGENGNFSPDAAGKDFSCRQPFWGAGCR